MAKLSEKEAIKMLKSIPSNVPFVVVFIKRTTDEPRAMRCEKGVSEFIDKTKIPKAPPIFSRNLMNVWDRGLFDQKVNEFVESEGRRPSNAEAILLGVKCYRTINLEMLVNFEYQGVLYEVNDFKIVEWDCSWKEAGDPTIHHLKVRARTEDGAAMALIRAMNFHKKPRGLKCQMLSTSSS